MIAAVHDPRRAAQYRAACAGWPYLGARMQADLTLYGEKTHSGWQFFAGPGLALSLSPGGQAAVCAAPGANWDELAALLTFLGVEQALAPCPPPGYARREVCYCWQAAQPPRAGADPAGLQMLPQADPWQLAELLAALSPAARQDFAADACVRRNHGQGLWWGVQAGQEWIGMAGVCAVTAGEACVTAIELKPEWRGQGIGRWLTARLTAELLAQGRRPRLLCKPALCSFYRALGFAPMGAYALCAKK